MNHLISPWLFVIMLYTASAGLAGEITLRLYQGAAAYIDNPQGVAMQVAVDVRDWNLMENGPRELLLKIYDPAGRPLVRRVIEDDGVSGDPYLPETGGWDHEMWYYALCYGRGSRPMLRWSSFTEPTRAAALPKRTFEFSLPAGTKGIYRVVVAGSRDHLVTLRVTPDMKMAIAGHPLWLHGHGDLFKRSYVYVAKGASGLHLGFAEFDQPATRRFTITAADGTQLWEASADGGFRSGKIDFEKPGQYDDQVLTVEVSEGAGDYMMHIHLTRPDIWVYRGAGSVPALYAPDLDTARRLKGGAIYHQDKVFWHPFQVRFHDWLAKLKPDGFVVRDAAGKELETTKVGKGKAANVVYKELPQNGKFISLNGPHERPPLSDSLMHHYPAHKNRAVLNLALRDLAIGLNSLTLGDMSACSRWNANFGYLFATYGWHFWRPAWRVLQQSEAPPEVKEIVREGIIMGGDRLAFGRGIERTNGNAFSHIPMALHYVAAATKDPIQRQLADTYFDRFISEGWGRGTGISKSGDSQEHFAHDFHYGSYIFANYRAVTADFDAPKFDAVLKRIAKLYSYLYCADASAYVWDARTHHGASANLFQNHGLKWQAEPGPDFTVSVNKADEWFAARRPAYYFLSFHGNLAPSWLNNYFGSRMGYGGGALCQLTVPGKGTVLASTLNGSYGKGMQRRNWRNFHIHSIVGVMKTGEPLVTADSIHHNAKLDGNIVSGSGDVRDRPIHVARSYTFEDDAILCSVRLTDTMFRDAYWGRGPSSDVAEAHEMIPFVAKNTTVTVQRAGEIIGELTAEIVIADAVFIDRGGYGVRIELPAPMPVHRGAKNTVLLTLTDKSVKVTDIALEYRLAPYVK